MKKKIIIAAFLENIKTFSEETLELINRRDECPTAFIYASSSYFADVSAIPKAIANSSPQ